jgi:hypothetical protein
MKKNIDISDELKKEIEQFKEDFNQPTLSAAIMTLITFGLHHTKDKYTKEQPPINFNQQVYTIPGNWGDSGLYNATPWTGYINDGTSAPDKFNPNLWTTITSSGLAQWPNNQ